MADLFPYQQQDLEFLKQWGRSANFSEPGVGKTPVGVRLIQELQGLPCLIIVPNVVRYHWEDEIKKFWVGTPPSVAQYPDTADITIVNYERFRMDFEKYFSKVRYKMAILDEAHRIKNRKAKTTKFAYKLNAEYMHLITGTPITKQIDDLWSYLHILFPKQFKSYWRFVERYAIIHNNGFGREIVGVNPNRLRELQNILNQFSVRHTKKEILPHLPDKVYQTLEVDLLPEQKKAYKQMVRYMLTQLPDGEWVEASTVATQILRLRQIALSTALIGDDPPGQSAKLHSLLELLEARNKAPTVIMTYFKTWANIMVDKLEKEGYKVVKITGDENDRQKREAQLAFENGLADVCVCTISAAGVGIDLVAADTVIFTDLSWSATDNLQAEDRLHRASQTKKVHVVRLFGKDTVDSLVYDRAQMKATVSGKVLIPTKELRKSLMAWQ